MIMIKNQKGGGMAWQYRIWITNGGIRSTKDM